MKQKLFLSIGAAAIMVSAQHMLFAEERPLIDFGDMPRMEITNDGVMGGLSKGEVATSDETFTFSGTLSLENNGGFSLVRIDDVDRNLSAHEGIELEVKGDGRTYGLRLTTDQKYRFSRVAFEGDFETEKGEWTTVRVPFDALDATWRGREMDREFDAAKLTSLAIIIADKQAGPFAVEVRAIRAY